MAKSRRPTEHVHELVRQSRLRVVVPIQLVLVIGACALVWGVLGRSQTGLAYAVISILIVTEVGLLIMFLRQPPESDEATIKPLVDNADETVLEDPRGGTIVVDRRARQLRTNNSHLTVPLDEARAVHIDLGDDCRLLLSTQRDLVLVTEIRDCLPAERARLTATGRLLARAAAVPFEGE
jgi:hypothetical protein